MATKPFSFTYLWAHTAVYQVTDECSTNWSMPARQKESEILWSSGELYSQNATEGPVEAGSICNGAHVDTNFTSKYVLEVWNIWLNDSMANLSI